MITWSVMLNDAHCSPTLLYEYSLNKAHAGLTHRAIDAEAKGTQRYRLELLCLAR